jgi:UDP-galactopyranose mutase
VPSTRPAYDWLIVGAGLTGAVAAERIASQLGQRVLVVDRRAHIGGNTFDAPNADGIVVHVYGPHIFHTRSERVWRYLSRFTQWRPYAHRVQARVGGRLVPVPFNLDTLHALFPAAEARRLEARLVGAFGRDAHVPVLQLRQHADPDLRRAGEVAYEALFDGYTRKQWGVGPDALDASVTARVPIRLSRDDRYFQDPYQGIPAQGYAAMVQRILDHPGIDVALETDFARIDGHVGVRRVLYTGPLDALMGYAHGVLPYRSLRFEHQTLAQSALAQPVAQLNHPDPADGAFTRVVEHRHLTGQQAERTTLTREFSLAHVPGQTEPYYPIPQADNERIFRRYRGELARIHPTLLTAGRLADYRYYNMDQAVGRALSLFAKRIRPG